MLRRWPVALVLAVAIPALAAAGTPPEILPLDQIKPGMMGVGRTVFEGTRIEDFKVQIIGVLENIGPKQSLILARLCRPPPSIFEFCFVPPELLATRGGSR